MQGEGARSEGRDFLDENELERPSAVRWVVFALACGASFLLYVHRYTWNIVGPQIQTEFRLTNTQAGFLFSLFYYTYAVGQIPSGVAIDRFGAHRFLSLSIVSWSVALAAIAASPVLWLVGSGRLVFGAAQAGCYPALTKVTRDWFPENRRTLLQGWIATTAGRSGGALAPIILGTFLMGSCGFSWRLALGVLGLVGIAYGVTFWSAFRDTPADHPGVNKAERALIEKGSTVSRSRAFKSLHARRIWRSRSMAFFVVQQFLDAGADVAFVSLIGTYFLQSRGFSVAKTGWVASLPLWGAAVGGIAGGWLNDHLIVATRSRRWTRSGVGFAGKVIGCLTLILVVRQSNGVAAGLVLMVSKFFSDWSQPTTWGACTDLGGRHSATVFSIINTAGTLGGVVLPLVFGYVLDAFSTRAEVAGQFVLTTDWNPLFTLLAAMYVTSGLCWLMVDCSQSLDVPEE